MVRNMGWLAMSFAIAKPVWFLFITAATMRFLSTEGYGVFTASLALTLMTSSLADLGTARYTVREIARRRSVSDRLFTNIIVARIVLAAAGFVLAMGIGLALQYPPAHLTAVAGAGVYALAFRGAEYCRSFYQAFEVLKFEALLTVVEKFSVVGLGFAALYFFGTPEMVFLGMATAMVVTLALNLWWVHVRLASFRPRLLSRRFMAKTVRIALPIGIIGVFGAIPLGVTPVIVEAILGQEAAGLYGGAQRIVETLMLVSTIVAVVVFPRFSALFHVGKLAQAGRLLAGSVGGLLLLGMMGALFLTLFAPWVFEVLTGSEAYAGAIPVLRVLAWSFPFMSVTSMSVGVLIAAGSIRYATISTGLAALACVILALGLTPVLGMMGAVIAYNSAWVLTAVVNLIECRRLTVGHEDAAPAPVPTVASK